MTVYFYHTQDTRMILSEWEQGRYPGHLLYGATHLPQFGIDVVPYLYPPMKPSERWKLTLKTTWRILTCRKHYDALYATAFRGLEGIILLRALRLYRKPVILWHHQPIVRAKNRLRELAARLFYRGIDRMFFFSQALIDESLKSRKADPERMTLIHWGPDLDFYDRVLSQRTQAPAGFITTGKERRDLPTLLKAFSATRLPLDMYINPQNGGIPYAKILDGIDISDNIRIHQIDRLMIGQLAQTVAQAKCIVICCLASNYTVGLTTLVEALALGTPVVCTANPTFPFDIDREGVGISVAPGDQAGWESALRRIDQNPDEAEAMGKRGRRLAENQFNLRLMTNEIADAIKKERARFEKRTRSL